MDNLNKDFNKLAKKTKVKRHLLSVVVVIVIGLCMYTVYHAFTSMLDDNNFNRAVNQSNIYNEIEAPNTYINNQVSVGEITMKSDTYKNIDGYNVAWEPQTWSSNGGFNYANTPLPTETGYLTQSTQQRVATFFLPGADYNSMDYFGPKPTQQVKTLAQLPNQLAEVAVSFDKPYTYAEIQQMVPKNLLINWYWIGYNATDSKSLTNAAMGSSYFGLSSDMNEKSLSQALLGTLSEKSYQYFVSNVKQAQTVGLPAMPNGLNALSDLLKQVEKYPTLATAKFSGVILTGRTENFAQLDSVQWIYATNVGLTTEILPFQQPTK